MRWALGALLVLAVWLVLTVIFDKLVMHAVTRQWSEAEVPNLVDLSVEDAELVAATKDFEIAVSEKRFDPVHEPGIVLEQFPIAGNISKTGRKIKLTVSAEEKFITVPDVVGIDEKDAFFQIEAAGLNPNVRWRQYSGMYPPGVVVSQEPDADSSVKAGSQVDIVVSLGTRPEIVTVPDLIAMNIDDARQTLRTAGLEIGSIDTVAHPNAGAGLIVSQEPASGVKVRFKSTVNLQIAE